ncbi:hypothetical protein FSP39_006788, partial [Pinctada imbricata]
SVEEIKPAPLFYESAPTIGGLSHQDTAILAGVLTGLATFLFLALPILCCLCPLPCCAACGRGGAAAAAKKKSAGAIGAQKARQLETISARSTDVESVNSFRSFSKEWDKLDKYDYDNLHEVDMRLPRVWLESLRGVPGHQLDDKLRELETGWEGQDIRQSELERRDLYSNEYASGELDHVGGGMGGVMAGGMGGGMSTGGTYVSAMGGGGGYTNASYEGMEGPIEIERTRQINIETTTSQLPEAEYIYAKDFRQ